MAQTLNNARIAPAAATLTTLYTAPAATKCAVASLKCCNTSSVATSIRIAVRPLGAAIDLSHYIQYDLPLSGNNQFEEKFITLNATDVISVYCTLATVSFNLFLQENT